MPESPHSGAPSKVGDLFARTPFQFGVRGDARLWLVLRHRLSRTPLPGTSVELRALVLDAYEAAMGAPLEDGTGAVDVARFEPGHGMAGGHVLPHWWAATGIPILVDRFRAVSGEGAEVEEDDEGAEGEAVADEVVERVAAVTVVEEDDDEDEEHPWGL